MGIGKFSEPRKKTRHSGINVGETSIGLNLEENTTRNETISINTGIGKRHDPKQYYNRKSQIKSEGGYNEPEQNEGE